MNATARRIVRSLAVSSAAAVALLSGAATANAIDSASGHATDSHRTAIVQLASDGQRGTTVPQVPPNYVQPATYNTPTQLQTQASGGAIGVTVAVGIGLLLTVIFGVKGGKIRAMWATGCVALGVLLAPTFVGPLVTQLSSSLGGAFGSVWAGL